MNEPVGFVGCDGTNGVDHHHFCALAARLFNKWPQVSIGEARIGSPQHDVLRIDNVHWVGTAPRTSGCYESVLGNASAQCTRGDR